MSAGFSLITNKQLKKDVTHRWRKYFVDFTFTKKFHPSIAAHLTNWSPSRLFNQANRVHVPQSPGIYLFFVKPNPQIYPEQSYIMYVGYSMNLFNRYRDYLVTYKNSDEPNYFERRLMLNAWEDCLFYSFIELQNMQESVIQGIEEKIIDAIVPPINRDFANAKIKQQVRLNRF